MNRPNLTFKLAIALLALFALPCIGWAEEIIGKNANVWITDLNSADARTRRNAAFALGRGGDKAKGCAAVLVELLNRESDPSVREAAVYALGEIGPVDYKDIPQFVQSKALPAFTKALRDTANPKVRRSAAYALGRYGIQAAKARTDLEQALKDPDGTVRQNAAYALGRLGRAGGAQETIKSLESRLSRSNETDELVRRDAANALNDLGRPMPTTTVQALFNAFNNDGIPQVSRSALTALVNTVSPENSSIATELAKALLSKQDTNGSKKPDVDIEVYRDIAFAMGNIGGQESRPAVKVLIEGLSDPDVTQRQQSAASLAMIGKFAEKAADPLAKSLSEDSDPIVRRNAALALGTIKTKTDKTLPALVIGMRPSQPEEVRRYSVEAVAYIGEKYPGDDRNTGFVEQAASELVRIIKEDKRPRVRQRAIWALSSVGTWGSMSRYWMASSHVRIR